MIGCAHVNLIKDELAMLELTKCKIMITRKIKTRASVCSVNQLHFNAQELV